MRGLAIVVAGWTCLLPCGLLRAEEPDACRIRTAVERALPSVQRGLVEFQAKWVPPSGAPVPSWLRETGCISCHHEGIGLTTLSFLDRRGYDVDKMLERKQADTLRHAYDKLAPIYRRALTDEKAAREADFFEDIAVQMGYMLGGLLDSGHRANESTDAATRLLMKFQQEDGSWSYSVDREPMQSSDFATTALAARVLGAFPPKGHAQEARESIGRARKWLQENRPESTDDLAFRLLGLKWLDAPSGEVAEAAQALRSIQRKGGGWAQNTSMKTSDAYATGLALLALNQAGGVPATDPAYRSGLAFLLETQRPDGTWFVRKWCHGYNGYFDAGFPHGKSQFISLPATCYAMMALATAIEEPREVAVNGR